MKGRQVRVVSRDVGSAQGHNVGFAAVGARNATQDARGQPKEVMIRIVGDGSCQRPQARCGEENEAQRAGEADVVDAAPVATDAEDPHAVDLFVTARAGGRRGQKIHLMTERCELARDLERCICRTAPDRREFIVHK